MTYKYFIVSYDLHRVRDYDAVERGIDVACIDYVKPLESVYILKTNSDKRASEVRDTITRYMDSDDSLLVIECNINSWGARKIPASITDVMKVWK